MKTDLFQSCGHCWVFQIWWHIECSTYTASYFRIWNSSTGIPSLPLALFIVLLSKAHLTSHYRISGSRWVITPSWLSWSWRSFLYSSSVYSCHLFLISSASDILLYSTGSYIQYPVIKHDRKNMKKIAFLVDIQFSSVAQSCLTLCDPMNHRTRGLPVHHQLPESTQTHVHWVSDAIQPSHPLSSPSPPALNLSQHQGLFKGVSSSN